MVESAVAKIMGLCPKPRMGPASGHGAALALSVPWHGAGAHPKGGTGPYMRLVSNLKA